MKNILIIGANGSLAREVIAAAERHPDLRLTLFARRPKNAAKTHRTFAGDALNVADLTAAMAGQDVVYVNLAGDLAAMGANIVAMKAASVRRVVAVSSIGIYDEPLRPVLRCAPTAHWRTSSNSRAWTTQSCAPTGSPTQTKWTTNSRPKGSLKAAARCQGKVLRRLCVGFLRSPSGMWGRI